mmetsp:Transcript_33907/g.75182  ORF Transcript_33907/g.75182 Transcript_33907/m.75182 type:complete len:292 (+) Transcript_33907:1438-2313(+)
MYWLPRGRMAYSVRAWRIWASEGSGMTFAFSRVACMKLLLPRKSRTWTCGQGCRMPLLTSSAKRDSMLRSEVGSFFFLPFLSFLPFLPFFLPFFFFFFPFLPSFAARSASTMSLRFCSSTRISSSTCSRISSNTIGRSSSLTSSASYFWKKLSVSSRSCHLATNSCTAASMLGMNTLLIFSSLTSATSSPFFPFLSVAFLSGFLSLALALGSFRSSSRESSVGGGGLRMTLEPPSSWSGKSGYSPVSSFRLATNQELILSWMVSRMSCPSSSRTFCLRVTMASSYSRACSS